MIDYAGLRALSEVIECSSFEKAAKVLHVSQSAVSQRIANLEAFYGQRLIVREQPYQPTEFALPLLAHLRQVRALEAGLSANIESFEKRPTLRLAANRDSLDLWLMRDWRSSPLPSAMLLEVLADDQGHTLRFLKEGRADLAISSVAAPLAGCESDYLGSMKYILVCRPEFKAAHLPGRITRAELRQAPAVVFDAQDATLTDYLAKHHSYDEPYPANYFPSTKSFKAAIMAGIGYGLLPSLDIEDELNTGALIQLNRRNSWRIKLYLHTWQIKPRSVAILADQLNRVAAESLGR